MSAFAGMTEAGVDDKFDRRRDSVRKNPKARSGARPPPPSVKLRRNTVANDPPIQLRELTTRSLRSSARRRRTSRCIRLRQGYGATGHRAGHSITGGIGPAHSFAAIRL